MNFYVQETIKDKSFVTSSGLINVATASEVPFLLFKNPTGSAKSIIITNLSISSNVTTDIKTFVRVYQTPTITTDGTQLTPTNMKIGSATVNSSLVYKSPTISNNGTIKITRSISLIQPFSSIQQLFVIEPGHEILVTVQNLVATSTDINIDMNWLEVI